MCYEVVKSEKCRQKWKDRNKKYWPYISTEDAEKLELHRSQVFADTSGRNRNDNGSRLKSLEAQLPLSDVKENLSQSEKIIGYIPCKDEEGLLGYVRIVKKKRKWNWILLFLVSVLLIGGGIWWILNQGSKVDLDEAAIAYQMPNGMKNENPSEIMIPVFESLTMPTGSNKVEAGLVNPEGNPCYFQYSIYLKDGNELLYESKWLEPGTAIVEFEVEKELKAGEYPITISVKTGALNDPEAEMNGGEVDSVLKVE
ncbi:MAG: hypothetical protein KH359_11705 [Clostridiales bacterium]|nr:hypothetical protein [Proteus hauseri]MBS6521269.1 hypothetical protein [Clostridiales bacterium]